MSLSFPSHIRVIQPYIPGKPIDETRREFGIKKVVKLASNENPLGPSPKAVAAVKRSLLDLHRYPNSSAEDLKKKLADKLDVAVDQIAIGNGSNEMIDLLIRSLCVPDDAIVTPKFSFIAYRVCAQVQGVQTLEVPVNDELEFDFDDALSLIKNNERVRLVFLANPNNPTGVSLSDKPLEAFLSEVASIREGAVTVVLDYAYVEYVARGLMKDPTEWFKRFSNVVVLRTFSKIYGLAGLRLGYALARKELTQTLEKVRMPFNVCSPALVAGAAALSDHAFVKRSVQVNEDGQRFWRQWVEQQGVQAFPMTANFFLFRTDTVGEKASAFEVFRRCLKQGLIVRPVANYGLTRELRVTLGAEAENRFAKTVIEKSLGLKPARRKTRS